MGRKILLNKLLYTEEHLSCRNYLNQVESGFKYIELEQEVSIHKNVHAGTICYCFLMENLLLARINLINAGLVPEQ